LIGGIKMNSDRPVIGIDIGGANTKVASLDRQTAELHYLPLWKDTRLPEVLQEIVRRLQPRKVGVVMTGELADCFSDKEQGIRFIMDAVEAAFPKALYLNNRGEFIDRNGNIRSLFGANWIQQPGPLIDHLLKMPQGQPLPGPLVDENVPIFLFPT
jgi:uncharacterized hydantoinase/oxoprolinase family protein